jgi:hypothetical protein
MADDREQQVGRQDAPRGRGKGGSPPGVVLSELVPRAAISEQALQEVVSKIEVLAFLPPTSRSSPRPQPERFTFRIGDGKEVCYGRILSSWPHGQPD